MSAKKSDDDSRTERVTQRLEEIAEDFEELDEVATTDVRAEGVVPSIRVSLEKDTFGGSLPDAVLETALESPLEVIKYKKTTLLVGCPR